MDNSIRDYLLRQFDIAWKLAYYHLDGLTTEECLWRPATHGPHVYLHPTGAWQADWPEHEDYSLGPPSIAWVTWHMIFWWSMTFDHAFGAGTLTREAITWPGDAESVRARLEALQTDWHAALSGLASHEFGSSSRTRWPFTDRPFGDVAAWVNIELTKNAAEIGTIRFLYAARHGENSAL